MKPINAFHLYGTLPTYDCPKCHNAISSRTCETCDNRLTFDEMAELLAMTEQEKKYFKRA